MKTLITVLVLLFVSCSSRMEDARIMDYGKKEIGKGLYLKKIKINGNDRVYILVDENNRLINGSTATSYTVYEDESNGTTTTRTKSNSLINP